jgi:hypothetical protein
MVIVEARGQLDIGGSTAELNAIGDRIACLKGERAEVSFAADAGADPRPYDRCLAGLVIRLGDGPVRVAVVSDRVVVTGSASAMAGLASFFRFDADAPRGRHAHYEWFEGNAHVACDSSPLVVSVR